MARDRPVNNCGADPLVRAGPPGPGSPYRGTRRNFLSAGLVGLTAKAERQVAGNFVNESHQAGHRLRDHAAMKTPSRIVRIPVVIAGGGMAGLSAAWRFQKKHFSDFVLLEMEQQAGGNSRSGGNEISEYPWAAHYLPVPNQNTVLVREMLEEFGILKNGKFEERHLCHTPQERLFIHGRWQDGLEPEVGATAKDRHQYKEFEKRMQEFRDSRQYTIPMELGAKPSDLDKISMKQWLRQQKFDSPYLDWYVDYSTRDDYGASSSEVSAWAGVHYFASREREEKGPLTWPEGNGWILKRLLERVNRFVKTNAMVYRIEKAGTEWRILTEDTEYRARAVVYAAPLFTAPYVIDGAPPVKGFEYSPWLTANLTLDRIPAGQPAWDNVIFGSLSLGYVDAMHQSLRTHIDRSVWTYYWALAEASPIESRKRLLANDWGYWKEAILADLERAHPDIRQCVSRIDIMRMGHAMARPVPGFLTSQSRLDLAHRKGTFVFAHADLSGFSIFEEAQYRGVLAADRVLSALYGK